MYGSFTYSELEYASDNTDIAPETSISDYHSAYVHGFFNELTAFGRPAYISGTLMFVGNNELPEWGPTPGVDDDQHGYSPKLSYIVQVITPISSGKLSQVVNEGIILRLETRDGNTDLFTSVLDDSSTINNDGTIFNLPTWIPGPHG